MKLIGAIVRFIDGLNTRIGHLTSWLTTLLVVIVCYDVFTRYFLRKSSVAVQELEWHIFAIMFLIAAAYTLKEDGHVRVDVFYTQMPPRGKALINLLGSVIFLIPFSLLIIWTCKNFVIMSWSIKEISPDPGGLQFRYLLKAMIPLGFFFVLLQGVSLALRSLCTIFGHPLEPTSETPKEQGHA